ncbi:hypothetical protein Pmani_030061 [Petrolisthes manimaculis]|uniref:Uncharacterized protein n=1 Tax=Petrolisthes manimaculis TaxID=1843537 RepID=A0AAE1NY28_9EUCA|nr:hypothetical protein Pmani_030061 [Petrolisthes manimaculis]
MTMRLSRGIPGLVLWLVMVVVMVMMVTVLRCVHGVSSTTECTSENVTKVRSHKLNIKWPEVYWKLQLGKEDTRLALYVYAGDCTLGPICIQSHKKEMPVRIEQEEMGNITQMSLSLHNKMTKVNLTSPAIQIGVVNLDDDAWKLYAIEGGARTHSRGRPSNSTNPDHETMTLTCHGIGPSAPIYPVNRDDRAERENKTPMTLLAAVSASCIVLVGLTVGAATLFYKIKIKRCVAPLVTNRSHTPPQAPQRPYRANPNTQLYCNVTSTPRNPEITSPGNRPTSPGTSLHGAWTSSPPNTGFPQAMLRNPQHLHHPTPPAGATQPVTSSPDTHLHIYDNLYSRISDLQFSSAPEKHTYDNIQQEKTEAIYSSPNEPMVSLERWMAFAGLDEYRGTLNNFRLTIDSRDLLPYN